MALIFLSGCQSLSLLVKPQPVHCFTTPAAADTCNLPCDPPLDLADGSGDTLLAVAKVNRAYLVRCSARKDACSSCVNALRAAKVIDN